MTAAPPGSGQDASSAREVAPLPHASAYLPAGFLPAARIRASMESARTSRAAVTSGLASNPVTAT